MNFNPNDWQCIADSDGKAQAAARKLEAQQAASPFIANAVAILHNLGQLANAHEEPVTITVAVSCGQTVSVVIGTDKSCPDDGR